MAASKSAGCFFRDGLEVDFSILPAAVASAPPPEAQAVLARGFSILYDGVGLPALEPARVAVSPPPTQERLDHLSSDF